MSETLFSVVIPTHNGEPYIAEALESVLSQTYPQFEIIILEHESTDRTIEIVRSYDDPRIHLLSTIEPQTIESNWHRILDLELAPYLTILGHDDVFYPDFLHEISDLIGQEPGASLYITHFHIINSDGSIIRSCKPTPYRETGEAFLRSRQHFQRDSGGSGYVMQSTDFKRVNGFLPFAHLYFSDEFAFYRLADISGKVCSPRYLFGYRYHLKSESYMSGLEILKEASQQYYTALLQTPYANKATNMLLAQDYINKIFTRRYIRILANLMYTSDIVNLSAYRAMHNDVLKCFPVRAFSAYNIMVRIMEFLLHIHPSWARNFIAKILHPIIKQARGMKN